MHCLRYSVSTVEMLYVAGRAPAFHRFSGSGCATRRIFIGHIDKWWIAAQACGTVFVVPYFVVMNNRYVALLKGFLEAENTIV